MNAFICTACGTQYPSSERPPSACAICAEDRQYVPPQGQGWTHLDQLRIAHMNGFYQYEPGVIGIGTHPTFAIGQRALLVRTKAGNILWDCISLIDDATVSLINGLGGLVAIAISHPHFYSSMGEWSRAFGGVPIHLHADNRPWIMHMNPAVRLWEGETLKLTDDVTLIRCGGHFPGSSVMHWAGGANGRGSVFAGDTVAVTQDRKFVTFMYSYPNFVPLPAKTIEKIAAALSPYPFDALYSHFFDRVIRSGAKEAVAMSAARYLAAIRD